MLVTQVVGLVGLGLLLAVAGHAGAPPLHRLLARFRRRRGRTDRADRLLPGPGHRHDEHRGADLGHRGGRAGAGRACRRRASGCVQVSGSSAAASGSCWPAARPVARRRSRAPQARASVGLALVAALGLRAVLRRRCARAPGPTPGGRPSRPAARQHAAALRRRARGAVGPPRAPARAATARRWSGCSTSGPTCLFALATRHGLLSVVAVARLALSAGHRAARARDPRRARSPRAGAWHRYRAGGVLLIAAG